MTDARSPGPAPHEPMPQIQKTPLDALRRPLSFATAIALASIAFAAAMVPADAAAQEVKPQEPSEGRRILFVGDSHAQGPFGWALDYLLREGIKNSTVASYAVCASSPLSWIKGFKHFCGSLTRGEDFKSDPAQPGLLGGGLKGGTQRAPRLIDLLKQHTPDTVVISMGENLKGMSSERTITGVQGLVKRLECYKRGVTVEDTCRELDLSTLKPTRALSCAWILPPYSRSKGTQQSLQRLHDDITAAVGGTCVAIDSRPLTCKQGIKDPSFVCDSGNYHLSPQRDRFWALRVMDLLVQRLRLPLAREGFASDTRKSWNIE